MLFICWIQVQDVVQINAEQNAENNAGEYIDFIKQKWRQADGNDEPGKQHKKHQYEV